MAAPDGPRRNLYGRRRGHKLKPSHRQRIAGLLPALATGPDDPRLTRDPKALFGADCAEVWLEIGFGAGEHLAWQAAHHPEVGLVGAEFFVNGVASLLRHVEDGGLGNIRVHFGDGRPLLEALPDRSIARAFILFPDPWPKARHRRRRIVNRQTLDELARVMADGGELRLATDVPDYQVWMLAEVRRHPAFAWLARRPADWQQRPDDWPPTRYEEKAVAAGRTPLYLRLVRRPRTSG